MNHKQRSILEEISKTIIDGNINQIESVTKLALDNKINARDILEHGLIRGMGVVGEKFRTGEMFIPEVMSASQAMHNGIELISPLLGESGAFYKEKVILGTVKGDMHDIGKTLVKIMLKGGGFEVIDLGINVPSEVFIRTIKEQKAKVLGLSALLTTSMLEMKEVINQLNMAKIRDIIKVIVGGAPVTEQFARDIGADAYAADAGGALSEVKKLIGIKR